MNIQHTNHTMSMFARIPVALAALGLVGNALAQNGVAINNTGASPDPKAILDVSSTYVGAASKGLLIPRVASTASVTVGAGEDGILVYQTGGTPGYYYWNASLPAWVRVQTGAEGWEIWGNNTATNPTTKWFGTRDNQPVVFRTNNVERMRLDAQGDLGVGQIAPEEKLDVNGALRIWPLSPLRTNIAGAATTPLNSNVQYSTTDNLGVIVYHKDTLRTAAAPNRALMMPGHYGQTIGGAPGAIQAGAAVPNIGGWRKLENDYNEVFSAPYEFNTVTCNAGAGTVEIPSQPLAANGSNFTLAGTTAVGSNTITGIASTANITVGMFISGAGIPAGATVTSIVNATSITISANATLAGSPALVYQNPAVSPYMHNAPSVGKRYRKQFMILVNELKPELNQLVGINGVTRPGATQGLCPGASITSVQFWVNSAVAAAQQKNWTFSLIVKHAPFGVNNLNGGFETSVDPAAGCLNAVNQARPTLSATPNWDIFTLGTPFVWDGQRNIIIDLAVDMGNTANNPGILPVKYYVVPGVAPNSVLTYSQEGTTPQGGIGCSNVGPSPCNAGVIGSGMPSTGCAVGGSVGGNTHRPAVRFGVSSGWGSITPLTGTTLTGKYIQYEGGLVVEDRATTPPWGWQIAPYYAYKGPNTLSAQNGVYDGGVQLNDHVFDRYFDGRVRPEEASVFGERGILSIDEMARFVREERHLPTVKGRKEWDGEGSFSIGEMTNQLWATTETQALYITELNDRLNVLEVLSGTRPIDRKEYDLARNALVGMPGLTETEKATMLKDLGARLSTTTDHH